MRKRLLDLLLVLGAIAAVIAGLMTLPGCTRQAEVTEAFPVSVAGMQVLGIKPVPEADARALLRFVSFAREFARAEGHKRALPNAIRICADAEEIAGVTGLDACDCHGRPLDGACDLKTGVIYITRTLDLNTLAHECGHWFLNTRDEARADAFMRRAMEAWQKREEIR